MSRVFKKLVVHNLQDVVGKCLSFLFTTASLLLVFQATCFETECIILLGHQTNQVGERMLISLLLQYLQSVESSSISQYVCRLILQEPSVSYSKMQLILPFGCSNRDKQDEYRSRNTQYVLYPTAKTELFKPIQLFSYDFFSYSSEAERVIRFKTFNLSVIIFDLFIP